MSDEGGGYHYILTTSQAGCQYLPLLKRGVLLPIACQAGSNYLPLVWWKLPLLNICQAGCHFLPLDRRGTLQYLPLVRRVAFTCWLCTGCLYTPLTCQAAAPACQLSGELPLPATCQAIYHFLPLIRRGAARQARCPYLTLFILGAPSCHLSSGVRLQHQPVVTKPGCVRLAASTS